VKYALLIKDTHAIHLDVVEIARFLNQKSSGLGSDFVVAFDDTLARLENRIQQEVQVKFQPKFDDIFGEPIEADRDSPVSAKKFRDYYIFYLREEEKKEVVILAVAFGPRDPDYLARLLSGRK
jgi:hypothetical protein